WLSSPFTVRPGATSWDEKGPERMNPLLLEKLRLKRNMDVMAEMAQALGRDEDHRRFQKEAQALLEDPELCAIGTTPDLPGAQSACAFALDYDAVRPEDRAQVEQRMLEAIEDYGHNLSTGTPATPALLNVLMEGGQHELAWDLAMHPEYPSFGYMVDQRTGGIWERLDALHPTLGFNPEPMSGFIHVGFCPIAEWILRLAGGFVVPARGSGLERIRIAPVFPDYLQHSSASVQTVYGLAQVTWRRERHGILLDLTVPPGATVDLILPLEETGQLTESGQPLQNSPGLRLGQPPDGHTELQVEAGRYSFVFSDTLLRENSAG
ncbi:MAG: alpha-L-rhamnosidase C-terminal domain-containing protein, partial [Opitutales bacterium]